ncbi:hypothetical protein BDV30DRAFT_204544 [Aspergillus minisclerotigenes]|uniref:Uncharacterized protein n=1 Tax=Aspergillus minisclerotigenes TaxID=656917 RepID=A0A5N6JGF0_9EURO|nr:hypothetical protein BDV30DRAFT_204544 [Aspergillus minisclerotigenes]
MVWFQPLHHHRLQVRHRCFMFQRLMRIFSTGPLFFSSSRIVTVPSSWLLILYLVIR